VGQQRDSALSFLGPYVADAVGDSRGVQRRCVIQSDRATGVSRGDATPEVSVAPQHD
jgi:hypothetical protein